MNSPSSIFSALRFIFNLCKKNSTRDPDHELNQVQKYFSLKFIFNLLKNKKSNTHNTIKSQFISKKVK
jgi:hypothetical protein